MNEKQTGEYIKEYESKRETYKEFSLQLKSVVQNILDAKGVKYFSVENRAKTPESLRNTLLKPDKKIEKLEDVQDLAGVRVIAYVYADVDEVEKIVEENFEVKDKEEVEARLETDQVGYRAHHLTIQLSPQRLNLPEYQKFAGLVAELQICTVLQHAWAQVEHDQFYKPSSVLPKKIKRDLYLLAGVLELADNEFNRISGEINKHKSVVDEQTQKGELNIPIDSISIRRYFDTRFKGIPSVDGKFGPEDNMTEQIIDELSLMGITTLKQLDEIVPQSYVSALPIRAEYTNYTGIAHDIMILSNAEKYFRTAWKNRWGRGMDESDDWYKQIGADLNVIHKYLKGY